MSERVPEQRPDPPEEKCEECGLHLELCDCGGCCPICGEQMNHINEHCMLRGSRQ
jgi:hypothetical protein